MSDNIFKINLLSFRGTNSTSFTGRSQGKLARKDIDLDKKEKDVSFVHVQIPKNTTSFNPSFFLGLFYESIKKLNSVENFRKKFIFLFDETEDEVLKNIILKNIDEALFYAKGELKDNKKGFRLL